MVGSIIYQQNRFGYEKDRTHLDPLEIIQPLLRIGRYIRHLRPQLLPRSRPRNPPWCPPVVFWAHGRYADFPDLEACLYAPGGLLVYPGVERDGPSGMGLGISGRVFCSIHLHHLRSHRVASGHRFFIN